MSRLFLSVLALLSVLFLVGCGGGDFALPPGDVEAGKQAFVDLRCNACHTVADIEVLEGERPTVTKHLGGERGRVRSYEELVTSIVNPSHKISVRPGEDTFLEVADLEGKSRMQEYNKIMSVQQLVDITTFLQNEYEITSNYSYRELQ